MGSSLPQMSRVICPFSDAQRSLGWEEGLLAKGEPCYSVRVNDPCVSIGFSQDAEAEVDLALADELGIPVVRRKTGGGAVYRDRGCLAFSFVVPADCKDAVVCIVRLALDALGVKTTEDGRNDLFWKGYKVSGVAWQSCGEMILVHGSLLFDTDISLMSRLLDCGKKKYQGTSIASVKARVANLSTALPEMNMGEFTGRFVVELEKQIGVIPYSKAHGTSTSYGRIRSLGSIETYMVCIGGIST